MNLYASVKGRNVSHSQKMTNFDWKAINRFSYKLGRSSKMFHQGLSAPLAKMKATIETKTQIRNQNSNSDPQVKINNIFERKIVNIFLPISLDLCFGCSKEPSH